MMLYIHSTNMTNLNFQLFEFYLLFIISCLCLVCSKIITLTIKYVSLTSKPLVLNFFPLYATMVVIMVYNGYTLLVPQVFSHQKFNCISYLSHMLTSFLDLRKFFFLFIASSICIPLKYS